jgi:hypothetical protein
MSNFKTIQLNADLFDQLDTKRKALEKELGLKLSLAQTIRLLLKEA